ncbi:maleylacetate reductase [Pseudomonas sp. Z1-14]|uniref:maleylacetate reductase n=1 Tax=Pseudomonas sp. Z1-14 TaxID=2817409 RepID=UPI003DA86055
MLSFNFRINPARIVFGRGASQNISAEVEKLGGKRALILCTQNQKVNAERVAAQLGLLSGGVFAGAVMHTPVDVTEKAMQAFVETKADCIVAYGGGSTIGLGKAIALRNDAAQVVIATTYAGSEVTPVLGETENGIKRTRSDARILPETVIYDPELTLELPVKVSVASGLNAIAHAVEGLYAQDRNPISSLLAVEGLRSMSEALRLIVKQPGDIEARSLALYGAWLCGTVLGVVGMSLHHKLCHVLGGSFNLPHAETHAAILPHSIAYNARAAASELAPAAALFEDDLPGGLYDLAETLCAPRSLCELGLAESDLDRASDIAVSNPYWNPEEVTRDGIRALLQRAWAGHRPN